MKRGVQLLAIVIALGAVVSWVTTGSNKGWTKTTVPVKTVDAVTGIEGVEYRQQFVPGVDILGTALLGAGALAGVSLLIRTKTRNQAKS
jgi:hypothetical protein